MVGKVFKKFVNKRTVDHLKKGGLFYDFPYGFRFSPSTVDLLTFVSHSIASSSYRSGDTLTVALDISMPSNRVWYAGHLHKLKSHGISGQTFGIISSFLSN